MKQEQLIDDLIAQLDRSFAAGVGHVNVSVEDQNVLLEKIDKSDEGLIKEVETVGCLDCQRQNLACGTPTLMEGLDRNNDEGGN